MIYLVIILSALFFAIGFIVTEKNAKYILSGYNTLSQKDKEKVDLKGYISYFRNFHIILGVSFLVIDLAFYYFLGLNSAGFILGVYPILAYIIFIFQTRKYFKEVKQKWFKVGVATLSITLVFVVGIFFVGFSESKLVLDKNKIEIKGMYGEVLSSDEISSIELINNPPQLSFKTNGFALGEINKGFFKTKDGEVVKLILNSDKKPYILIVKDNGKKIYYSAKDGANDLVLQKIKTELPSVNYE